MGGLATGNNTLRFWAQDAGGNQTVVTRTVAWDDAPPGVTVIHYSYDSLQRLTQTSYSTGESYVYTYDPAGNRLTENSPEGNKSYWKSVVHTLDPEVLECYGPAYAVTDEGMESRVGIAEVVAVRRGQAYPAVQIVFGLPRGLLRSLHCRTPGLRT